MEDLVTQLDSYSRLGIPKVAILIIIIVNIIHDIQIIHNIIMIIVIPMAAEYPNLT